MNIIYKVLALALVIFAVGGVSYAHFYSNSSVINKISQSSTTSTDVSNTDKSTMDKKGSSSDGSKKRNPSTTSTSSTTNSRSRSQSTQPNSTVSQSNNHSNSISSPNPRNSDSSSTQPNSNSGNSQQTQNPPTQNHPTYNLNETIYLVSVGGMSCSKPASQINDSNESKLCTNIPNGCAAYVGISYASREDAGSIATQKGNNSQPPGKYFSPRCGGGNRLTEAQCQTYNLSCGRW